MRTPEFIARFVKFLLLFAALTAGGGAFAQTALNLPLGWSLLGNSGASPVDVATTFGDPSKIKTVWKWNKSASKWVFYAPSMTTAELAAYAAAKGYDVLTGIGPKEGFWVSVSVPVALSMPIAGSVALVDSDLIPGWNLVATADGKTPSQFNAALAPNLNAWGKSISTMWAWDAATARWKFYSPALAAQGGTVLSDYRASKSYSAFDDAIGVNEGYWVNVLSSAPPRVGLLTDTGITASQCYAAGRDNLVSCTSAAAIALNDQQDGMIGRDVANADGTDGKLGFSYSTVGNYAKTECVKDNITGLTWEGKTADGGLRDGSKTYTNYGDGRGGDASAYVAAVNATALCGYSDWRLPTRHELQSLVDYGTYSVPTIDAAWFPNTRGLIYWTSSSVVGFADTAWNVYFIYGMVSYDLRNNRFSVRLVR